MWKILCSWQTANGNMVHVHIMLDT